MKTQNEYRQDHIMEMSSIQEGRYKAARAIVEKILTNYTSRQILQILWLLEEGRSIIFTKNPKSPIVGDCSENLPEDLQMILNKMYPQKKKVFIPNDDLYDPE